MSLEGEQFAQSINEDLANIVEGKLWRPTNGGEDIVADAVEMESKFGPDYEYDYEPVSMGDWIGECYDWRYLIERDHSYRSVMLMLAGGGPTAWLNTENNKIEFSWGMSETEYYEVYPGASEIIDEYMADCFF